MSDGHKKYLIGKLRKARHALKVEADTYEVLANNHRKFRNKVDILETFAGNANISKKASNFGLKAAMLSTITLVLTFLRCRVRISARGFADLFGLWCLSKVSIVLLGSSCKKI